jgi:hypothetical protein
MEKKKLTKEQIAAREKKRRRAILMRTLILLAVFVAIGAAIWIVTMGITNGNKEKAAEKAAKEAEISKEEAQIEANRALIAKADSLASGYDYDGAIALLQTASNYDSDSEVIDAIAKYTVAKTTLETVDVTKVPHIFYHSLIVDTERAFNTGVWGSTTVAGINAWMTTISEFDRITQQMYDNGWVLVRMRDLVTSATDADGTVHFSKNKSLMLPSGKHAYVLSVDDWSYYHSYDQKGYADKAVLDENGDVKCEYTDTNGNVTVGDYDVVPRLNTFLKAHPDASYKGARGMLAMTGYNGCFGYRTDEDYVKRQNLQSDQIEWLNRHPDFDEAARQEEIAAATKIADKCKADGWEFANHTWGHLSVTGKSVETLQADNEKWNANVANIVGSTDIIIFAHGNDIGNWHDYDASTNPVYAYYKGQGYKFFANVDASNKYWVQIRDAYCRQGRIDCDGLQMWRALSGEAKTNVFEDMFNVSTVFDSARPTPVSASGKA